MNRTHTIITLTAGTEQDRNGRTLPTSVKDPAFQSIRKHLAATFGGFTETNGFGGWLDDHGNQVLEECKVWTIVTDLSAESARVSGRVLASGIAAMLNQSAVLCTVQEVNAGFVPNAIPD